MNFVDFSRYRGAIILVAITTFFGCTALSDHGEQKPRATAIVIPQDALAGQAGKTKYPPQCDTQCQKIWDTMSSEERTTHLIRQVEVLDDEVALQAQRADAAASAAGASSKGGCLIQRPNMLAKQRGAKSVCGTAAVVATPAASAVSQPMLAVSSLAPVASAPTFKLADPVTERRTSTVGSYDWMWDRFGYTDGQLVYRPYSGANKSVHMTEQGVELSYECPQLRVPETDHVLRVRVTAAVSPSLLWETDYHRLVAKHGATSGKHTNENFVSAEDVAVGAKTYVGQHQEKLCQLAATKSLADLFRDPSLGAAEELNRYFRRDARAEFDVLVQKTNVELPEALLRALALKGVIKP